MSAQVTIRRFRYNLDFHSVVLAINTSVLTEEMANEINDFLSSPDDRLEKCDGDIYRVVGRMFAFGLIANMLTMGGGTVCKDSSSEFVRSTLDYFGEGWPDIDQLGITVEDAYVEFPDEASMDDDEMDAAIDLALGGAA